MTSIRFLSEKGRPDSLMYVKRGLVFIPRRMLSKCVYNISSRHGIVVVNVSPQIPPQSGFRRSSAFVINVSVFPCLGTMDFVLALEVKAIETIQASALPTTAYSPSSDALSRSDLPPPAPSSTKVPDPLAWRPPRLYKYQATHTAFPSLPIQRQFYHLEPAIAFTASRCTSASHFEEASQDDFAQGAGRSCWVL